jgi:serine beta-lactamase-like protein LACTB, mitochondrial
MSWKQKGLGLIGLGIGLIGLFVAGLFVYIGATAKPLHPNPQDVPSVMHQAPPQEWRAAVEQARRIVRDGAAGQNLPGVSVAVAINGELVWTEGFGWAQIPNHLPVTPDVQFRIGTASQALTSAAVGLLLEKGRLNLDDEIQAYVPAFPKKEWPVTLRHLMGNVAGVRTDAGGEEPVQVEQGANAAARCTKPSEGLQRFAVSPLRFEPGTQYRTSSYGWIVVSAAVEAAAEEPFATFMRRQVFEPLGMTNTLAESPIEPSPERATFYFPRFSADPRYGPDEGREVDYSCFAGSAAFVSTPTDLVRYVMGINSGKLLRPATVQLLQTSQRLASGQETGFGLGWDLETVSIAGEPTRVVGYDGELMGGVVGSLMTFPDRNGLVVSVLSNIGYADTFTIGTKIAEAFVTASKNPAGK